MAEEKGSEAVAAVTIVLGAEDQLSMSVSKGEALSAALVQLKGECMQFLGDYLLRRNTPLEETGVNLEESLSDEEEDNPESRTSRT